VTLGGGGDAKLCAVSHRDVAGHLVSRGDKQFASIHQRLRAAVIIRAGQGQRAVAILRQTAGTTAIKEGLADGDVIAGRIDDGKPPANILAGVPSSIRPA